MYTLTLINAYEVLPAGTSLSIYPSIRRNGQPDDPRCLAVIQSMPNPDDAYVGWQIGSATSTGIHSSLYGCYGWWVCSADFMLECNTESVTMTQLAQANERVRQAETNLKAVQAALALAKSDHANDVAIIGARLLLEAEENEWCSTYDEAIEEVNRGLVIPLPVREREFLVTVQVTYTVEVEVTAADEQAAKDIVDSGQCDIMIDEAERNEQERYATEAELI